MRAEALRWIAEPRTLPVLLRALEERDPFLELAAREGLRNSLDTEQILGLATLKSPAQRLGILLVLRDVDSPSARKALTRFCSILTRRPFRRYRVGWRKTAYRIPSTAWPRAWRKVRSLASSSRRISPRSSASRAWSRDPKDEFAGEDYVARLVADPKVPESVRRRALRACGPIIARSQSHS